MDDRSPPRRHLRVLSLAPLFSLNSRVLLLEAAAHVSEVRLSECKTVVPVTGVSQGRENTCGHLRYAYQQRDDSSLQRHRLSVQDADPVVRNFDSRPGRSSQPDSLRSHHRPLLSIACLLRPDVNAPAFDLQVLTDEMAGLLIHNQLDAARWVSPASL